MATAPEKTTTERPPADAEFVRYEQFIDSQLRKTRWQVRTVDVAGSLLTLAVGTLVYLFVVALVDHWVVAGGLGHFGRAAALTLYLAAAFAYAAVALLPLVIKRINPVYAAHAIERSRPTLKNSLVNFLLLRSRPEGLAPPVYEAMEKQAATGLAQVSIEHSVDRSKLVMLGWVLLALVAACAVYKVASPKDPLRSFRRVIAPWADIAPPTRVTIADVQPGTARAFHDQFVTVSAQVAGAAADEAVQVFYSTADGQVVDRAVPMSIPQGTYRYVAELPPQQGGLQQDIDYWIVAGDAISERYHIQVLTTPSIVVERVDYEYPKYTEMLPRSVERQGDLSAIEGTRVTLHAAANDAIKAAHLDFDCDGRRDLAMQIDGRQASASFVLALKKDSQEPEHASYQLRFLNRDGEENPKPVRHKIEVVADHAPEIAFRAPEVPHGHEQQLAVGDVLKMVVEATDPDYQLASVKLLAERNGKPLLNHALLPAAQSGQFQGTFLFDTKTLALADGDAVTYWAEAVDNKAPDPNRVETPRYTIRVGTPRGGENPRDKADPKQQPDRPRERDAADQPDRQPPPRQGQNQDQDSKQNNRPRERGEPQRGQPQRDRGDGQPAEDGAQAPAGDDPQPDGESGDGQPRDGSGKGRPGRDKSPRQGDRDQQNPGDQAPEDGPQEGAPEDQARQDESRRVDPDADPGSAFDKILKRRSEESQPNPDRDAEPEPSDHGDRKQGSKPDRGANQDEKNRRDEGGEKSDRNQDQPDSAQSDKAQNTKKPNGGKQDGNQKQRNEKPGDSRSGDDNSGDKKQPPERGNDDKSKDAQPDDNRSAGEKSDGQRPGEKSGAPRPRQNQPDDDGQPAGAEKREQQPQGDAGTDAQRPGSEPGREPSETDKPSDDPRGEKSPSAQQGDERQQPKSGDPAGQSAEDNAKPPREPQDQGGEPGAAQDDQGQQPSGEKQSAEKQRGEQQSSEKQSGQKQSAKGGKQPGGAERGASDGEKSQGAKGSDDGDAQQASPASKPGEKPADGKTAGGKQDQTQPADRRNAQPGDEPPPDAARGDKGQKQGDGGQGAGTQDDSKQPRDKQPLGDKQGGNAESHGQGDAGAGRKGGNDRGSPAPQEANQPREKADAPPERGKPDSEDTAESPSGSKRQSDSRGEDAGDRSGGGSQGGGQRSNSQGTGSAGQNTAADEGGGRAEQSGDGETAQRGGDKKRGQPQQDGQAGQERGAGSKTAPGGDKQGAGRQAPPIEGDKRSPAGEANEQPDQPPTADHGPDRASDAPAGGSQPSSNTRNPVGGRPTGGGGLPPENGDSAPPPPPRAPSEQGADDPNLEYTKKATDLALEYLKDQLAKDKPDPRLLEDLKWTREDMQRFVDRWEKLKQQARGADPAARRQLDEKLESLGLRPRGAALRGGQTRDARSPVVRDSRRSEPPPEYADQYREYTKGISRGRPTNAKSSDK